MSDQQLATIQPRNLAAVTDFTEQQVELIKRTIAVGTGEIDRLELPFLPNNADIRIGDLLVTSGLGGAFPAGYPVAIVSAVTRIPQEPFADVSAEPAAALDQVREVMLIWSAPEPAGQAPDDEVDKDE